MLPGYEVLDHPSDVELKLHAPTWPELLVEAGDALSARLWAGTAWAPRGPGSWRRIELHSSDRSALLVAWLNELLYDAEAAWWLPVEFVVDDASSQHLRAQVRGVGVTTPPPALKGATLHGVQVTHGPRGYDATAVLDL